MTHDRFAGWHQSAIDAQLAKEKRDRQFRRKAWLKTADVRRIVYRRIAVLSTVELIETVGDLGGGDGCDGCFTREGQLEFAFAKRTLRERVRALETENTRMREELAVTRDLLRTVPVPYQYNERQPWYADISDYLETL